MMAVVLKSSKTILQLFVYTINFENPTDSPLRIVALSRCLRDSLRASSAIRSTACVLDAPQSNDNLDHYDRAGDRTRTGDVQLGKLAFYQLNYARD
jgi:hypothetical protein